MLVGLRLAFFDWLAGLLGYVNAFFAVAGSCVLPWPAANRGHWVPMLRIRSGSGPDAVVYSADDVRASASCAPVVGEIVCGAVSRVLLRRRWRRSRAVPSLWMQRSFGRRRGRLGWGPQGPQEQVHPALNTCSFQRKLLFDHFYVQNRRF